MKVSTTRFWKGYFYGVSAGTLCAVLIAGGMKWSSMPPKTELSTGGLTAVGEDATISRQEIRSLLSEAPLLMQEERYYSMGKGFGEMVELSPEDQLIYLIYSGPINDPEAVITNLKAKYGEEIPVNEEAPWACHKTTL